MRPQRIAALTTRRGAKALSLRRATLLGLLAVPGLAHLASAAPRGPVIDVHVHTEPGRYALVAELLAATDITRFINLSGGSWGRGLAESLDAARDFDGRILVCANIDWRQVGEPDFGAVQAADLALAAAHTGSAGLAGVHPHQRSQSVFRAPHPAERALG